MKTDYATCCNERGLVPRKEENLADNSNFDKKSSLGEEQMQGNKMRT